MAGAERRRWAASTANVEKVVNPPMRPMARNGRSSRFDVRRSKAMYNTMPRANDPPTLMHRVVHGNPVAASGSVVDSA
jgi:hypothetical protein